MGWLFHYSTGEGKREGWVMQMEELEEIKKSLATIERLIQQLPEVMAATYIQMNEEYEAARMPGKSSTDLWEITALKKQ